MKSMIDLSWELIQIIKKETSSGSNAVDMLMKILSMRKESAYRRLRGDVPLELNEAVKIAQYLNLSIDEILMFKKNNFSYTMNLIRMNRASDTIESYCQTLRQINNTIRHLKEMPDSVIYSAVNKLPEGYVFRYEKLCKFRLFKFIYQCRTETLPKKLAEIRLPPLVHQLELENNKLLQQIAVHLLIARDVTHGFAADARFFYSMGLVTKDEIKQLQEDFHLMIDGMEKDVSSGYSPSGAPLNVYLSDTYFDASYIYMESSALKSCSVNVFGINYYSSAEPDLCEEMKDWIQSLMRYSVLISKSSAFERANFLKHQRMIIDTMID